MKFNPSFRFPLANVVKNALCCGCGTCVAVCPRAALAMRWMGGRYLTTQVGECSRNCRLCSQVCPFVRHERWSGLGELAECVFGQQTRGAQHPIVGWHQKIILGHVLDPENRKGAASGGFLTWLLSALLRDGAINSVICATATGANRDPRVQMAVFRRGDDLQLARGSFYYPVEWSKQLQLIRSDLSARCAVVGLPCFTHAVRRAMLTIPVFRERIRYVFGLACGYCPRSYYTDALIRWIGSEPRKVWNIRYRHKADVGEAWDFGFRAMNMRKIWSEPLGMVETFPHIWRRKCFALGACQFCDDVFAEAADACFMDAWLPGYIQDPKGHSLSVIRDASLLPVFMRGVADHELDFCEKAADEMVSSQQEVVTEKRERIAQRIEWAREHGMKLPALRHAPGAEKLKSDVLPAKTAMRVIRWSNLLWPAFSCLPRLFMPFFWGVLALYEKKPRLFVRETATVYKKLRSRHRFGIKGSAL
jgi:coenzyme F420 hydrogenase subunit beta